MPRWCFTLCETDKDVPSPRGIPLLTGGADKQAFVTSFRSLNLGQEILILNVFSWTSSFRSSSMSNHVVHGAVPHFSSTSAFPPLYTHLHKCIKSYTHISFTWGLEVHLGKLKGVQGWVTWQCPLIVCLGIPDLLSINVQLLDHNTIAVTGI